MDRHIKLAVIGGLFTLLGGIFCVGAWLFWPLPNPEFDWRTAADELAAQNLHQCVHFEMLITGLPYRDPDAAEEYLDEQPLGDRCPALFEGYAPNAGSLGRTKFVEDDMRQEIAWARERRIGRQLTREEQFNQGNYAGIFFGPGTDFWIRNWLYYRDLRRTAKAGWLGWPDLAFMARCRLPMLLELQSGWDRYHRTVDDFANVPPTSPAWDRRREWCHQFALEQAHILRQDQKDLDRDTDPYNARQELIDEYVSSARTWD